MTQADAIERIEGLAADNSRFKIGKTGQELSDRFDSEYKHDYDKIIGICHSSKARLIDKWEKDLIAHFQADADYKGKCDNDTVGGGEMDEAETYRLYVAVKK